MNVTIRAELAQALLNYLMTQPYGAVHQLVAGLKAAQPAEPIQTGKVASLVKESNEA